MKTTVHVYYNILYILTVYLLMLKSLYYVQQGCGTGSGAENFMLLIRCQCKMLRSKEFFVVDLFYFMKKNVFVLFFIYLIYSTVQEDPDPAFKFPERRKGIRSKMNQL